MGTTKSNKKSTARDSIIHITKVVAEDSKSESNDRKHLRTKKLFSSKILIYVTVCICFLVIIISVFATSGNSESAKQESRNYNSKSSTTQLDDSVNREHTEDNEESLIEESKYDPICKEAINKRYGTSIDSIHWTNTQNEDETKNIIATINYGYEYKGTPEYICYVFHENGEYKAVVYDGLNN